MTEIVISDLKELCHKALRKTGLSDAHIEITVDHYLENECAGKKSHGIVRAVEICKVINKFGLTTQEIDTVHENKNTLVLNGNKNLGPVIGKRLQEELVQKGQQDGMAFTGAYNYIGNTGSMAYYLRKIADHNLIGIMSCNSETMVSAPNGKERLIGTNPIGLAVPSDDGNHFIADFATSAIAKGKIMVAMDNGEALPSGRIIDKDGKPSSTPDDALSDGAILPLADYRGFSLGLFVELIAMMIGGKVLNKAWFGEDGFFMIAINPHHVGNLEYSKQVANILEQIRNSDPAPGHNNVSVPGDRSAQTLKETLESGVVNVADKTLEKLESLAS